jgi:deazaflavin-dependent oxidoreductase (nitroreductase family)
MADMNDFNTKIIKEFRENGGVVGAPFEGSSLLILHTTGAKSGEVRENPVVYKDLGGSYAVFASKGGAPTNPDWYYNLLANPKASLEVGTETIEESSRIAEGDERERLWTRQKSEYPGFADYEKTAGSRQIPVVILERAG